MIKNLSITALVILCVLIGLVLRDQYGVPKRNLVIFYTSNLRGQIKPYSGTVYDRFYEKAGGFAFIKGFINNSIKQFGFNPKTTLLLDTGDALFGSAEASLSMGEVPLTLMNKTGYDAMAIGNMEFEFGFDHLKSFINSNQVPMLACNYRDVSAPIGKVFKPGILTDKAGIKVGIIGLGHANIDRNTRQENIINVEISDMFSSVNKTTKMLKAQGAEIIILLSHHPELDKIENIASKMPGVDVIIGDSIRQGGIPARAPLICQTAPSRGSGIGVVKIPFIGRKWDISKAYQHVFPINSSEIQPDPKLVDEINQVEAKVDSKLEEVITTSTGDFNKSYDDESTIGNLIADSIKDTTKSDIAFQNSGGIKSALTEGKVTLRDLFNVLPFENTIVTMDLKGYQIENIVEESLSGKGGFLQQSGIRCTYSSSNPLGFRVIQIDINDEPLEFDKTYNVAMNDFMASNDHTWPDFQQGKHKKVLGLIRENLEKYLRSKKSISPDKSQRFTDYEDNDDALRLQPLSFVLKKLPYSVINDGTSNSTYGRLVANVIRIETHADFAFIPASLIVKSRTPLEDVTPARIISDFTSTLGVKVVELDGKTLNKIIFSTLSSSTAPLCFSGLSIEKYPNSKFKIYPWETSFANDSVYKVSINEKFPLKCEGYYNISSKKFYKVSNDIRRMFLNGLRKHPQEKLQRAFY